MTGRDLEPALLDSERDRAELRDRYYGLLQELRVVLPGVQVLVAFLLTAPFGQRFADVDTAGRALYGAALTVGVLAVVAFVTPTVLHRFGDRTARSARLALSISVTRLGLVLFGLSMVCSFAVVVRFLFDPPVADVLVAVTVVAMLTFWAAVPRLVHHHREPRDDGHREPGWRDAVPGSTDDDNERATAGR
ncbi:MAG TPA: DUF6328 family protein [Acidimicrobiia bacterium]|nr:DUF6328 family protein [Acidimicrobiia bacterium]